MARNHGRILSSIWSDDDFRALEAGPQRLYLMLLSQPNLGHTGVLPLTARRWAATAAGMTADGVLRDLAVLEERRFVVVDFDTEEVMVRTLIRNDQVWRNPKVMLAMRAEVSEISSPLILAALRVELTRIPLEDLSDEPAKHTGVSTRDAVGEVVRDLLERLPDTQPDGVSEGVSDGLYARTRAFAPAPTPTPTPTSLRVGDPPPRDDVQRICDHLADRIEANGAKRPTTGKGWHTAARLMLDRDGRSEEQVHKAIDWCQADEFWRANILSMPKLREKYDQLRLQAQRPKTGTADGRVMSNGRYVDTTPTPIPPSAREVLQGMYPQQTDEDRAAAALWRAELADLVKDLQ